MTTTIKFYGASDDLLEVECDDGQREELCDASGKPFGVLVETRQGSLWVVACYGALCPCWALGIAPLDEDVPLPWWADTAQFGAEGYTATLELDVPFGWVLRDKHRKVLLAAVHTAELGQ